MYPRKIPSEQTEHSEIAIKLIFLQQFSLGIYSKYQLPRILQWYYKVLINDTISLWVCAVVFHLKNSNILQLEYMISPVHWTAAVEPHKLIVVGEAATWLSPEIRFLLWLTFRNWFLCQFNFYMLLIFFHISFFFRQNFNYKTITISGRTLIK